MKDKILDYKSLHYKMLFGIFQNVRIKRRFTDERFKKYELRLLMICAIISDMQKESGIAEGYKSEDIKACLAAFQISFDYLLHDEVIKNLLELQYIEPTQGRKRIYKISKAGRVKLRNTQLQLIQLYNRSIYDFGEYLKNKEFENLAKNNHKIVGN